MKLQAPFPYFGGKAMIAHEVWAKLGNVKHYMEPFFGSGAVLLARPNYDYKTHLETICDADGHVANVWRSLKYAPDEVAKWCDNPVNHVDLMAVKRELKEVKGYLLEGLVANSEWHDPKWAGYWIWVACCSIGKGLFAINDIPHVSDRGQGIHKLSKREIEETDLLPMNPNLYKWFQQLAVRLRYVRVVCGDWSRVCGGNWQDNVGTVGIFLDPPYSNDVGRYKSLYTVESANVAKEAAKWAGERGKLPSYRIVLAGYEGEHNWLEQEGWSVIEWKAKGGFGNQGKGQRQGKDNAKRERLWCSPYCVGKMLTLFE